jgi:hypothetical protein
MKFGDPICEVSSLCWCALEWGECRTNIWLQSRCAIDLALPWTTKSSVPSLPWYSHAPSTAGKRSKENSFLFLVNTSSSVLPGLTDKPVSLHQVFAVLRDHYMSPDDAVFGNFPIAKRNVSVTLSIYSEPHYQIISSDAPQEWRQHVPLWTTTRHHNPSEWIIKGRRGQAALHSSFNPSDNVVANPYLTRAPHMESKDVFPAGSGR